MNLFLLFFIFFLGMPGLVGEASNGILMTPNARGSSEAEYSDVVLEEQVDHFLEAAMIQTAIRTMGEVIERTVRQAQIGLMPDFALIAAHQGASQCFQQPQLMELIREVYREARASAIGALKEGQSPGRVQEDIKRKLETDLRLLVQDPVYQHIVEKVIEHVYQHQQSLVRQNMIHQYLQQMSQQQQGLRQELAEQYQKGILVR